MTMPRPNFKLMAERQSNEIHRLGNEIERLRTALQQIADFDGGYDSDAWCITAKIATEALKTE